MSIAVSKVRLQNHCAGFAEREFDVDRRAHLRRERFPEQREIAFVHPILKKSIGRFDSRRLTVEAEKVERSYPGFKTDLTELIAHAIAGAFPKTVHFGPLPEARQHPIARLRVMRN